MCKITFIKILFFSAILLAFKESRGQNLVSNGDFEQHTGCPSGVAQLNTSQFWTNPAGYSPDYYHECGIGGGAPPNCAFGYQYPRSDSGMAGIGMWWTGGLFREYIQAPLTSQLVAGMCYHFEMYVNLSNDNEYATDAIGAYFSDVALSGLSNLIGFTPQISNTTGFITDTLNWTLVSGNFTATGNENFLIIGNFKDDAGTDTITVNPNGWVTFTYYYIDDVSLTLCTGIEQNISNLENLEYLIYPNPASEELFINSYSLSEKKEIIITDVLGKEVYHNQFQTSPSSGGIKLQTSGFKEGVYFIEIKEGKNIYRKKFLKENFK